METKITDQKIIELFYGKRQIKASLLKKYKDLNVNDEICEYLKARFNDSESLKETLYRIKNGIEIRPVCKTCRSERLLSVEQRRFHFLNIVLVDAHSLIKMLEIKIKKHV